MERIRRLRFFIIAALACAILFCIAGFSVSYAKWDIGDSSASVAKGSDGKFYVECPQYVTGEGENATVIPQLQKDKYYLQVPQRGNTAMSDYYEFGSHDTANEVKLQSVYLYKGDVVDLYYAYEEGTESNKKIIRKQIGIANSGTGQNLSADKITYSGNKYTIQENGEGFYDFYYNYSTKSMWTVFIGKPSEETVDSGNTGDTGNAIDTTGYTELFSVKFSGEDLERKLYFKTGTGATGDYADLDKFAVHIRANDWSAYYYNSQTYPGSGGSGDGNMRKVSYLNKGTVNVGTKDITVIVFGFDEQHISGSQTAAGSNGNAAPLSLADYAKGDVNCITLHTSKGSSPVLDKYGSGSGSSSGGGGTTEADNRTPADPDCVGSTSFAEDSNATQTLAGKTTVREVNAKVTGENTTYVYKNYLAVSRRNSESTDDDNSIAYIEFRVSDCSVDPYSVQVKSLKITRRATDDSGNITGEFIVPAPRIYNYDSSIKTMLGPADTHDKPDTSGNRFAIFAHGNQHVVEGIDPSQDDEIYPHMQNHFDDGVYVVLYFGDHSQQYFALDIELELDKPVDFKLTAEVSNKNSWERYQDGYGEPWGYYMGGLINSVETWDPSRTTKLERATDRYKTDFDPTYEESLLPDIENATDAAIDSFNNNPDFNYKIIRFYKSTGAFEGFARYPEGKIDVSLTVNLTEGSLVKMYMLDHDGHRLNGHTVYVMPNEIEYDAATKALFLDDKYKIYDEDLNIIIPQTGTYVFRLVGHFHTGDEEVNGKSGRMFDYKTGERCVTLPAGHTGGPLPNFNLIVDTLYITCSSVGNTECNITLNANGGTFEGGATTLTTTVTFGSSVNNLPKPTRDGKTLMGWYYTDADGERQDIGFDSTITGDMNLNAWWSANYTVTFDANGGALSGNNTATTDAYGNLTETQINAFVPTRDDHEFLGWYTTSAQTGGVKITPDYTFEDNTIVYARWKEVNKITITFNLNGLHDTDVPDPQPISEGGNVIDPTSGMTLPTNYNIEGWYTTAACTTKYNFDTPVSSATPTTLYAKWYAEDGVYVKKEFKNALTVNEEKPYEEQMVLGVRVTEDNSLITIWYNKAEHSAKIKTTCPFYSSYSSANGLRLDKGNYNFYYNYGTTDPGLWVAGQYIVTLDPNDGATESSEVLTGDLTKSGNSFIGKLSAATVSGISEPTRTGYRFDGWYTLASGGDKVALSTTYTFNSSTTLYAHWIKTYTVTFDANGGAWGDDSNPHTQEVAEGDAPIKPEDDPTRSGYKFTGWYANTEGGDEITSFPAVSGNVTYYAHWEENTATTYTITFNANGGTCTMASATTNESGNLTTLPTATRDYHTFDGWYTAASGGTQVTTSTTFSSDTPVYAHWTVRNGVYAGTTFKKALTVNPTNSSEQIATEVDFAADDIIVIVYNNTIYDASNKYDINEWYDGYVDISSGMYKVTKAWLADLYFDTGENKLYVTTSDKFITSKFTSGQKEFGIKLKDGFIIIRHNNSSAGTQQYAYVSDTGGDASGVLNNSTSNTEYVTYNETVMNRTWMTSGSTMYISVGNSNNSWTNMQSFTITEGSKYALSWNQHPTV
ncbi:MAG: InlB B-repeat-containing protein [Clostridiales bacterium]|nr:InlB B-repeat-containing protein [Clostridiales bacterium]